MPPRTRPLTIDIRDPRIPGGRFKVAARTTSRAEHRRRELAVRRLVDLGEFDVLQLVRDRKIRIDELAQRVEAGTWADLRPAAAGDYPLQVWVDRMLERVPRASYEGYASTFRRLVEHFGPAFPMATLTRDQALAFLHAPKHSNGNKPWEAGTRNLARIRCGALWDVAMYAAQEEADRQDRRSGFRRNPWKAAQGSRGTKEDIRPRKAYLQPEQWDRLIGSVRGTRRALLYGLCCLAGLRKQEALQLRTGIDVELSDGGGGRVRIQPRDGELAWKPKTARSVRDVPITPELRALIEEHIASGHAGVRYLIRGERRDAPVHANTADEWVKSDFPAAGLKHGRSGDGFTLHSLRHTYASWLVQMDAPTLKVATMMGDTVAMVERVYGHLAPADLARTALLIDQKLQASRIVQESTRNATGR